MNLQHALLISTICILLLSTSTPGQESAEAMLRRVDQNMTVEDAVGEARMTIRYRDGDERVLEFKSWGQGQNRAFLEFTRPARDAGSRFLRLDESMWIYLPRAGKSVRIQGHMLRQGLMGSDFSYGDASERPSMTDDYDAIVEQYEEFDGRPTAVLYLTARRDDLAYPSRRIWVDTERWVPLKEERFARSGKLLKTATLGDVRRIGNRWYPFRIELDNALQADTRTTLEFTDLRFDADIPDDIFTRRHLESGM